MVSRDLILRLAIAALCLYRLSAAQSEDCDGEFTIRPQDVVARAGEMAMMQCEYINQEPVEWDKDGTSVISGDSPCDCTISRDGHLLFNNVSAEDVGDYTCVVTIMFNPHRCSATLRLAEFPRFTNKVDPGPTSSNSRVLSVLVTGDPTPDVEWLHNDEATDVSSNSRLSISSVAEGEGQKEMLTITDIQPEDRGTYTLRANNIAGRAEEDWLVPVAFGHVDPVQKERSGSKTQLTCTGQFHSQAYMVKWLRGDLEVGGSEHTTTNDQMQQREFKTILEVEISSCGPTPEVVKCQLKHDGNTIQEPANICDECSPPTIVASVGNCSSLTVELTGSKDSYVVQYKPSGSQGWTQYVSVTLVSSPFSVIISDLMEGTQYDIRATCAGSDFSSNIFTASTQSIPPVITGVTSELMYSNSGTFVKLTWEGSTAPYLLGYNVTWHFNMSSDTKQLPPSTIRFDWPIVCNVTYVFKVAAINLCATGPFSASVQQLCSTVPPPQRVELHELPSVSGASLTVTFTVNHIDLVKSFRIDVLEQDDNFVTLQTLNYTITEAVYKEGTACIAGLSTKAQFLVCVRVEYSDIGEDSTCSRTKTSKEAAQTNVSCQFPTSRRVEDREDGTSSPTIPDWGIAVMVVGALLMVALLFCFLGLCFACQTSNSKNDNFGSSSSINTERGGNVVPTTMHMHNPSSRAMSPTRSCLKYHRDRGHSTTWNDHVDTLRQMETDKGTHV